MDRDSELVMYLVVNQDLEMSTGKILAQVGHALQLVLLHKIREHGLVIVDHPDAERSAKGHLALYGPDGAEPPFAQWFNTRMKKVTLRGRLKQMEKLEAAGFIAVRDAGYTEVPPNSLTVVALPPMTRAEAKPFVGRLQTY